MRSGGGGRERERGRGKLVFRKTAVNAILKEEGVVVNVLENKYGQIVERHTL